MWDLLQFIWTFYTSLNFVCVPVEFTCTYTVGQKQAHLVYHCYVYLRDISFTMQDLWLIISNTLLYFVHGTVFLIFMLCAFIYTTYIWWKMKNMDRQWFIQAYLFLETKNLQNSEKCTSGWSVHLLTNNWSNFSPSRRQKLSRKRSVLSSPTNVT